MTLFSLWDLVQSKKIAESTYKAETAKTDAIDAQIRSEQTQFLVERLILVTNAMWEILSTKLGVSEHELLAKIADIDLRDSKEDGKLKTHGRKCSECNRVLNSRHFKCIYCGSRVLEGSAFDPLTS